MKASENNYPEVGRVPANDAQLEENYFNVSLLK